MQKTRANGGTKHSTEPPQNTTAQRKSFNESMADVVQKECITDPGRRRDNNDIRGESAYKTFYGNCHSESHREQRVGPQRVEQSTTDNNRIGATTTKHTLTDTFLRTTIRSSCDYGTSYRINTCTKGCIKTTVRIDRRGSNNGYELLNSSHRCVHVRYHTSP